MSYEDKDALLYLADVRIDELQAENARLRGEFRKMDEWHSKELVAAIDENDKLRELVRAMWLYDYAGTFSSAQDDVEHVAMVYQRMHELGVEV